MNTSAPDVRATAIRAAVVISVVRLGVFSAASSLMHYADGRQVVGYFLLILNSIVELSIASPIVQWSIASGIPKQSAVGLLLPSALIVITSAALGLAYAAVRHQQGAAAPHSVPGR
jgi:hypothetical protein